MMLSAGQHSHRRSAPGSRPAGSDHPAGLDDRAHCAEALGQRGSTRAELASRTAISMVAATTRSSGPRRTGEHRRRPHELPAA